MIINVKFPSPKNSWPQSRTLVNSRRKHERVYEKEWERARKREQKGSREGKKAYSASSSSTERRSLKPGPDWLVETRHTPLITALLSPHGHLNCFLTLCLRLDVSDFLTYWSKDYSNKKKTVPVEFGVSQEGSRSQQNAIIGLKKQKQKKQFTTFWKKQFLILTV